MHDLGERVKELRCLYTISNLIALGKSSKEELLRGVVNALPKAFQFPEYMVATIESKWGILVRSLMQKVTLSVGKGIDNR